MDNVNDVLQLYRGKDFEVSKGIKIRQPKIGEICDFGEKEYFTMVSTLVATPFDMIAQLDKVGIDFTQITEFELFAISCMSMSVDKTRLLFGDLDLSIFKPYLKGENKVLLNNEGVEINQYTYMTIVDYLRKIHNIQAPLYKTVGNEATKQKLIEFAYDDLKYAGRKKYKSQLLNSISFLINNCNSKCTFETVWDLPICAFFDSIKRVQTIDSVNWLYTGIYTGNVDFSKINKKELNGLRDLS